MLLRCPSRHFIRASCIQYAVFACIELDRGQRRQQTLEAAKRSIRSNAAGVDLLEIAFDSSTFGPLGLDATI